MCERERKRKREREREKDYLLCICLLQTFTKKYSDTQKDFKLTLKSGRNRGPLGYQDNINIFSVDGF